MGQLSSLNARQIPFLIGTLSLCVALAPYLVFGTHANVVAHDHLDANFTWAVVLAHEGQIFAPPDAIVEPFLGGLERRYLGGSFQLYYWIFALVPPFAALVVAEALTRAIAYIGAFVLIRHLQMHVVQSALGARDVLLCAMIAAGFALLSFWPSGGAAVAGVPLFFWAALIVRYPIKHLKVAAGIACAIVVFVLYGSLVLSGVFALTFTTVFLLRDMARGNWVKAARLAGFNAVVSAAFIAQNSALIAGVMSAVPTSRDELIAPSFPTRDVLELMGTSFLNGQYHADPGTSPAMLLAVFGALLTVCLMWLRGADMRNTSLHAALRLFGAAFAALCLTAAIHGIYYWDVTRAAVAHSALSGFNFGRFHWLQPALWMIVFAAALFIITVALKSKRGTLFAMALAAGQIVFSVAALPAYSPSSVKQPPFADYFAEDVFSPLHDLLADTGQDVRLGMIGIHPAIAQFSGFRTVDAYLQFYPLETKVRFRKIIAKELDKDKTLARYFDEWGNRAYLFAADLEKCRAACYSRVAPKQIQLDFDIDAFKDFGGTHIVSASKIMNASSLGLTEIAHLQNDPQFARMRLNAYVYAVKSE